MFFKTKSESREWAQALGFNPEDFEAEGPAHYASPSSVRLDIEMPRPASVAVARQIVSWLGPFSSCVFWITEHGIFSSYENRHLYYKLRASYGDFRELHVAPGHDFLDYETSDLVTFVDLAIQFRWGGHLVATPLLTYIFISHDGWVLVKSESQMDRIMRDLRESSWRYHLEDGDLGGSTLGAKARRGRSTRKRHGVRRVKPR